SPGPAPPSGPRRTSAAERSDSRSTSSTARSPPAGSHRRRSTSGAPPDPQPPGPDSSPPAPGGPTKGAAVLSDLHKRLTVILSSVVTFATALAVAVNELTAAVAPELPAGW